MKNILIAFFLLLPATLMAQSNTQELTPQQRLERAKQEAAAAKQAIKDAKKAAKEQEKAARQAEKERSKAAQLEEKAARAEAEAARLKQQAEAERQKLEQLKQSQIAEPEVQPAQPAVQPAQPEVQPTQPIAPTPQPQAEEKPIQPAQPTQPAVQPAVPAVQSTQPVAPTPQPVVEEKPAPQPQAQEPAQQSSGWSAPVLQKPVAQTPAPVPSTSEYLAGAVPELEGKVVFTLDLNVPGRTAEQIYNLTYSYLNSLTTDGNQRTDATSNISLVNPNEKKIAARYFEWLVFHSHSLSLDRSKFNYTLLAECTDGHLHLTMERISYGYEEHREGGFHATAEELITDKQALSKKKGTLNKQIGKFRTKTIDRKNEIFNSLTQILL